MDNPTNDQIRVKVAELCGKCTCEKWTQIKEWVEYNQDAEYQCDKCGEKSERQHHDIPNYQLSLDACAEGFENIQHMTLSESAKYCTLLHNNIFADAKSRCLAFIAVKEGK